MYFRKLLIAGIALILLALGCSDNGNDKPTAPQNNTSPTISIADITVIEGQPAVFVVLLNKTGTQAITFSYTANAGTAGSADFAAASGNGTIGIGTTSTTITVTTINDTLVEGNESFSVMLSAASVLFTGKDSVAVATIQDNDVTGVSYATDIRPILSSSGCNAAGSCHGSGAGGFTFGNLSRGSVVAASGNHGAIVSPGNASASNLYLKTTGTPPFLSRMPIGGPFLTTAQQNLIRDWINQGALDN